MTTRSPFGAENSGDQAIHVFGMAGSLREKSYNRALLRAAVELAPQGMEIEIWDHVGELPLYNADLEGPSPPAIVRSLRAAVRAADALLFVTPEYNYGVPAPLKNLVDWASRPAATSSLKGKPAGIMGASTGMVGTARAQLSLRDCFVFTQTYPLPAPEVLVARAVEKFDTELRLIDTASREFVRNHLDALYHWALLLRSRAVAAVR